MYDIICNIPAISLPLVMGDWDLYLIHQDLDPFSRFCGAQARERLADTPHCGNIGRISPHLMHSMQPNKTYSLQCYSVGQWYRDGVYTACKLMELSK